MFGAGIEQKVAAQVMAEYPKEACGVIEGNAYIPCTNIAADPENHFIIEEGPFLGLQAVIHSHTEPFAVAAPSKADMNSQIASAVPWGLMSTDGINVSKMTWFGDDAPITDLIGRNFVHGVHDCWGLVRDYYRLRGKTIIDFPRDDAWWKPPLSEDLLNVANFNAAGFTEITQAEMRKGDVVAANIVSSTINHVGIYVGSGLFLHHLYNRLSRKEPVGPWIKYCRYFLRYTG